MKKVFYLLPLSLLVIGCGGDYEIETGSMDATLEVGDQGLADSLANDSSEVDGAAVNAYESVEDYITILSKAELYDLFDEADLKDDESWYGEGTMKYEVTWLTNPANGHKVKYVWDEEKSEDVIFVEFFRSIYNDDFEVVSTQEILSNTGLYTGMPFEEVKNWNDEPFEFSGFGWDFAGGIMPEQGSKLEQNPYGLRLEMDYEDDTYEKYNALIGDVIWKSNAPETDGAPIHLETITWWGPQED